MRACALVLVLAAAAAARHRSLWLPDAVLEADVIATGTIERVSGGHYVLRVDRAVLGAKDGDRLEVQRFEDWTCARRAKPYRKDQRILALLRRHEGGLAPLGAACEGEVFLEQGTARVVQPPFSLDIGEAELVAAVAEFRAGYRPDDKASWRTLLGSERALVVRMMVEKLHWDSYDRGGLAAPLADVFPALLAHRDEYVRLTLAQGLGRIVGGARAADVAQALRGKTGLAEALALCHLDPKDTAALRSLLAVLQGPAPTLQEQRAVQHFLYETVPLGEDAKEVYPACLVLLEKDLPRDLAHAVLIALRRWHGAKAPLPHDQMQAEGSKWLARLRGEG